MNTSESDEALFKLIEIGKKEEDFRPKRPIANDLLTRQKRRERENFEKREKTTGEGKKGGLRKSGVVNIKKVLIVKNLRGFLKNNTVNIEKENLRELLKRKFNFF